MKWQCFLKLSIREIEEELRFTVHFHLFPPCSKGDSPVRDNLFAELEGEVIPNRTYSARKELAPRGGGGG